MGKARKSKSKRKGTTTRRPKEPSIIIKLGPKGLTLRVPPRVLRAIRSWIAWILIVGAAACTLGSSESATQMVSAICVAGW